MIDNFCIFILTHGRANKVYTYDTLKKSGYTGKIYIVIDNEDDKADEYYKVFGDKVLMFDKAAIAKTFDEGDNFGDRRSIVYARNACFELAKQVGIRYFMQLDDDYDRFSFKFDEKYIFTDKSIKKLDKILEFLLKYYKSITAKSIAIAQKGDFIGGAYNGFEYSLGRRRKCMNTFICDTQRPFQFVGRINEDVNTYTNLGSRGGLFLTIPFIAINQKQTQSNSGGMSELYLDSGTYIKSFYTILFQPSSVKIKMMGNTHRRLHHQVTWKNTVPMIIQEKYKKR